MSIIKKITIDNNKYFNIEYCYFLEQVNKCQNNSNYNIIIELTNQDWLQIFYENNRVSIVCKSGELIKTFYAIDDIKSVSDILIKYYTGGKLHITQKPDEIKKYRNSDVIINLIGTGILVASLILLIFSDSTKKHLDYIILLLSIGMIISTFTGVKNKTYNSKNDFGFFSGIVLFFIMIIIILYHNTNLKII